MKKNELMKQDIQKYICAAHALLWLKIDKLMMCDQGKE